MVSTLAICATLMLAAGGCGGSTNQPESSTGPTATFGVDASKFVDMTSKATVEINVVDNTFEPSFVKVSKGTKLVFTNNGRNEHNVTAAEEGAFTGIKQADFSPGKVASLTVGGLGEYGYFCSIHGTKKLNGQSGVILVVG